MANVATIASLSFRPVIPTGYIILLGIAGAALLIFLATRAPRSVSVAERIGLCILRALFLAALLVLLLNPGALSRFRPEEEKPVVVWMIDRSQSMTVEDVGGKSRFEQARKLAAQHFTEADGSIVHKVFVFDSQAHETRPDALDKAKPNGIATDIPGSLSRMLTTFPSGLQVPAVFLISDGIQTAETDRKQALVMASARRSRVYPVVMGGEVGLSDLSVRVLGGRNVSFVGHTANLNVELAHESVKPAAVIVRLVRLVGEGKEPQAVATQKVNVAGSGRKSVTFPVNHDEAGLYRYRIEVDPMRGELDKQNNSARAEVITLKEKIRVLLVEGNPYWETKYVVQLLQKDPSINVQAMFMLARGRAFQVGEAAEGDADAAEPLTFPNSIEELGGYDVVILGQDVRFLIEAQHAALLETFLYDHGGALLFARGKPSGGEFPELARLEPVVWGEALGEQSRWMMPTDAGAQLPLFQYNLAEPLDATMRALPRLSPHHQVSRLKSFAEVFASTVTGERGERIPALIVRRMGKGIVATVNAEGLWRWDFLPPRLKAYQGVYPTFWGQLIRWMALRSDFLPGQNISFRSSGVVFRPRQLVRFTVAQRLAGKRPLKPLVRITRGRKTVQTLVPTPSRSHTNVWYAMCFLDEPGEYEARLSDTESSEAYDELAVTLTVKPRASETSQLSADPGYLRSFAKQTGARILTADQVGGVLRTVRESYAPTARERTRWRMSWDSVWFLVLATAAVALEWAWRRRKGLL